ncbi:uncharacterized protein L3040_007273 [Drepanopeziza brunnea f. sp. 'multigermtubi']|uniref:uncharacterized protein n=1 Tax=Drepanopeziza brunnea f. sp. 'multigermtubi' TaxID=698441 RepID=UPI00238CB213|nr:hypothetical protein L3040_007273 [Drepanopeziza brunnea f. sp. 'multigermtubi']
MTRESRHLASSENEYDNTIRQWLDAKISKLVLHCAILNNPSKDQDKTAYLALIRHLVSVASESLEQKSSGGWTPLQIAVLAHQPEVISYLLSEGANQRHHDKAGCNVFHSMIFPEKPGGAKTDPEKLQNLISLFEKTAVQEMLLERCTERPGALTPLSYRMAESGRSLKKPDIVKILAEHSNGEDLALINGEGDLPLHVVFKQATRSISYCFAINTQ